MEPYSGTWNDIRRRITSNLYLSRLGEDTGIDDCIHHNPLNPQQISATMRAATVDAIIGAASIGGGVDAAITVMTSFGLLEASTRNN